MRAVLLAALLAACGDDAATCAAGPDAGSCPALTSGLAWTSVPAATFTMGCSTGDTACAAYELPAHEVSVPAFEILATEVTQADYEAATGENPSFNLCPTCPVDGVTWDKADAFCVAQGGRLPSEAEWELAARAGGASTYACGCGEACLAATAWSSGDVVGSSQPVAGKAPNGYCLYDLYGNVWEWVADCWHDSYDGAPSDGSVWEEAACSKRVLRGGAFANGATSLRASNRAGDYPTPYQYTSAGFRCVRIP